MRPSEEHGNAEDWRTLVGTGSYLLTDWVEGSSLTYEKNPNYWGYDEKYPENRLPYRRVKGTHHARGCNKDGGTALR